MKAKLLPIRIVLNVGTFTNENDETYVGYGFTAYRGDSNEVLFSIDDLSVDANEVQKLIDLIVDNDVSPAHFEDLIEDFCV